MSIQMFSAIPCSLLSFAALIHLSSASGVKTSRCFHLFGRQTAQSVEALSESCIRNEQRLSEAPFTLRSQGGRQSDAQVLDPRGCPHGKHDCLSANWRRAEPYAFKCVAFLQSRVGLMSLVRCFRRLLQKTLALMDTPELLFRPCWLWEVDKC